MWGLLSSSSLIKMIRNTFSLVMLVCNNPIFQSLVVVRIVKQFLLATNIWVSPLCCHSVLRCQRKPRTVRKLPRLYRLLSRGATERFLRFQVLIQTLILQAHLDELRLGDVPVVVGVELAEHFLGSLHGETGKIKITAPQQQLDSFKPFVKIFNAVKFHECLYQITELQRQKLFRASWCQSNDKVDLTLTLNN